jgi:uncharacterized membrane protein
VLRWAFVPLLLGITGVVLVALAVLSGGAQFAIVVIVPVLFGRSIEFAAGVLLLFGAVLSLPFALSGEFGPVEPRQGRSEGPGSGGSGGLVLIGPVPIWFGSWSNVSARTRWAVALLGLAIVGLAVALLILFG